MADILNLVEIHAPFHPSRLAKSKRFLSFPDSKTTTTQPSIVRIRKIAVVRILRTCYTFKDECHQPANHH